MTAIAARRDVEIATGRLVQACDHSEQRGFARSVGPDDRSHLPYRDLESRAIERDRVLVLDNEISSRDGRLHWHREHRPSISRAWLSGLKSACALISLTTCPTCCS